MTDEKKEPLEGEVEEKPSISEAPQSTITNTQIYADIAQYTQRPDLFIAEVEKHDPGFVKRLNNLAEETAKKDGDIRFKFGKHQAYTGLIYQGFANICLFALAGGLLYTGKLGFSSIIGIAIFYAVIQSGFDGFIEIARGVAKVILQKTDKNN